MRPVLFSLGPIQFFSYGAMIAAGLLVALMLMQRQAKRSGFLKDNEVVDMVFIAVAASFAGARILYVLEHWAWYRNDLWATLAFWEGGLIFYGGIPTALLALWVFGRVKKITWPEVMDFILPYVALVHAFGRVGCFLNGCCYGKTCNLPWAVRFPELDHAVHPTQLYEAFLNFCLFFFLYGKYPGRRFKGEITGLYFFFYGIIRFGIEFWRVDNPASYGLTWNQWLSLAVISFGFFILRSKTKKKVVRN